MSSLGVAIGKRVWSGGSDTIHSVPALTFDALLTEDEAMHTAFLKVDTEGHEKYLVKAASKLHPRSMPMLNDVAWEIKKGNALHVCGALQPFKFKQTLPIGSLKSREKSSTFAYGGKFVDAASLDSFLADTLRSPNWACDTKDVPGGEDVWWTKGRGLKAA